MKKFDITEGNENVLYSITYMMIGSMIGLILFVVLLLLGFSEVGVWLMLAFAFIPFFAGLPKDIMRKRTKKES